MAIVIVATAGSATANSYGTVAAVDETALATAWAATWAALTTADKNARAVMATRALDGMAFPGWPTRTVEAQALQWPRTRVYRPDGTMWDDDVLPAPIVAAWAHLTAYYSSFASTSDPFGAASNANIRSETVGPISTEYFGAPGPEGWTFLETVIGPMLRPHGLLGASGTIRLVR